MMNDGMKIILERMKTHPEEFADSDNPFAHDSKWVRLFQEYAEHLPEEDVKEFRNALKEMRQAEFTSKVMEELLDPKVEEQLTLNPKQTANVTSSGGVTLGQFTATPYSVGTATTLTANSLTLGNQTLDESTIEHMKAHIEALKVKDRNELINKKSTTIFGKLFNYL